MGGALDSDELAASRAGFQSAGRRLDDPWLAPVRVLPWLGDQLDAVDDMSTAAVAALDASNGVAQAVRSTSLTTSEVDIATALTALSAARAELAEVDVPRSRWLVGPVLSAREELVASLTEIDATLARFEGLAGAVSLLASGDHRLLVMSANTSEMGSGTGMLLSYGVLTLDSGRLSVSDFASVDELARPSGVSISDEVRRLWFNLDPGHEWKYTSHLSSSGTEVARLAGEMFNSLPGDGVDGVIVISPVAMQNLMVAGKAVPIDVGDRRVPAREVAQFLGTTQYEIAGDARRVRHQLISPIATAALSALFDGEADTVELIEALFTSFDERHLVFWSRDDALQARWEAAGADGATAAGSVKVAIANAGGNKLDQFLSVDSNLEQVGPRRFRLSVTVENTATGSEGDFVAGDVQPGKYVGYLVATIPGGSLDVTSAGDLPMNAASSDGPTHSVVALVELDPGATTSFVVEFTVPVAVGELIVEASGRRPAVRWSIENERVDAPTPAKISP